MALRFPRRDAADAWASTTARWVGIVFMLAGLARWWRSGTVPTDIIAVGWGLFGGGSAGGFFRELARRPWVGTGRGDAQ